MHAQAAQRAACAAQAQGWRIELHAAPAPRTCAFPRPPDAVLMHYVHDITRTPQALDNLFAQLPPRHAHCCRRHEVLSLVAGAAEPARLAQEPALQRARARVARALDAARGASRRLRVASPRNGAWATSDRVASRRKDSHDHTLHRLPRRRRARCRALSAHPPGEPGARRAAVGGGLPGAVDARREPDQVAPRARHLVLRDLRARALRGRLRALRPRLPRALQQLLPGRRRAASAAAARPDHAADARRR